ncbi:hypothetical protein Tco_0877090 [Tanacetum coccineum]|uniref:Uncharacterized protein n=1 Tax=Tanacetum coccineum TaxID=301880 RepID=A0ABQ5BZW7_9ASTR
MHAKGRKSGARLSGGHFIGRLVFHFGLVSDEGLRGLSVITRELPMIDLHELAAGDAPAVDEGALADPAPIQAPQPPHAAPRTMPQRIARLEEEVHELWQSIVGLRGDVDRSITDQGLRQHSRRLPFDVSISRCDDFCDLIVHDENKPGRPCYNKIDELVMVYSRKRCLLNSYGHSDASSTHFCSRTQIVESSRAKYQGSTSF